MQFIVTNQINALLNLPIMLLYITICYTIYHILIVCSVCKNIITAPLHPGGDLGRRKLIEASGLINI